LLVSLGFAPEALRCAHLIEMPDCVDTVRQIVIPLLAVLPAFFALAKWTKV
jgi:hypothetical protein